MGIQIANLQGSEGKREGAERVGIIGREGERGKVGREGGERLVETIAQRERGKEGREGFKRLVEDISYFEKSERGRKRGKGFVEVIAKSNVSEVRRVNESGFLEKRENGRRRRRGTQGFLIKHIYVNVGKRKGERRELERRPLGDSERGKGGR